MLSAFTAGLLLIVVSELGDKTFFIAVILAMRHSRRLIYTGVTAALALMTVLSVVVGKAASLLPQQYIHYAEIALFFGFGVKLLYQASQMPANSCDTDIVKEATDLVKQAELKLPKQQTQAVIILEAFWLTFLAEWGDLLTNWQIALAASYNPAGVAVGAIMGHGICSAIAVIGGRMLAGRISERIITFSGGCLLLLFGVFACLEGA